MDIGLKYMAVDTKWTNINDAAATNGGMAIGANSNADGETSVAWDGVRIYRHQIMLPRCLPFLLL